MNLCVANWEHSAYRFIRGAVHGQIVKRYPVCFFDQTCAQYVVNDVLVISKSLHNHNTTHACPHVIFCVLKVLAKKMTVLYKLAKEQLSKQFHYDFGLRALKSVLVMGGGLKRASSGLDEASVLMRTLRDMNLPKLVYDDVPLFLGLLSDLFPGTPPSSYNRRLVVSGALRLRHVEQSSC